MRSELSWGGKAYIVLRVVEPDDVTCLEKLALLVIIRLKDVDPPWGLVMGIDRDVDLLVLLLLPKEL